MTDENTLFLQLTAKELILVVQSLTVFANTPAGIPWHNDIAALSSKLIDIGMEQRFWPEGAKEYLEEHGYE
jgi:hypothetical protein